MGSQGLRRLPCDALLTSYKNAPAGTVRRKLWSMAS